MVIGFTGTRSGMSDKQKRQIEHYLRNINFPNKVHHGMCIGADEDFHNICDKINVDTIVGHPGKSKKDVIGEARPYRADVECDEEYPETTHFERNRRIVDMSDIILACPYNNSKTGGTWYTINYAKKVDKQVIIFDR